MELSAWKKSKKNVHKKIPRINFYTIVYRTFVE